MFIEHTLVIRLNKCLTELSHLINRIACVRGLFYPQKKKKGNCDIDLKYYLMPKMFFCCCSIFMDKLYCRRDPLYPVQKGKY